MADGAPVHEHVQLFLDHHKAWSEPSHLTERSKVAAASLVFSMFDRAIQAQRDGGPQVDLTVAMDEDVARSLGFFGEGELRLSLRPCVVPEEVLSGKRVSGRR